ncbi:hypothetical protein BDY17DRAFT_329506 [Neohortaea acidophila]|uniref:Uncharacterized protein n=1 Tax=Neohortaea acidophila TaxID=245834 RepID=A0A6A6Q7L0_9PEZI|nr:uncharacterized protein BDY17DRAFT_329506 [Neohortaea acidophila]KAF2487936.1 hypothetical protein BDY17DRAFT_329506 [Neohortaea acidophila]
MLLSALVVPLVYAASALATASIAAGPSTITKHETVTAAPAGTTTLTLTGSTSTTSPAGIPIVTIIDSTTVLAIVTTVNTSSQAWTSTIVISGQGTHTDPVATVNTSVSSTNCNDTFTYDIDAVESASRARPYISWVCRVEQLAQFYVRQYQVDTSHHHCSAYTDYREYSSVAVNDCHARLRRDNYTRPGEYKTIVQGGCEHGRVPCAGSLLVMETDSHFKTNLTLTLSNMQALEVEHRTAVST